MFWPAARSGDAAARGVPGQTGITKQNEINNRNIVDEVNKIVPWAELLTKINRGRQNGVTTKIRSEKNVIYIVPIHEA